MTMTTEQPWLDHIDRDELDALDPDLAAKVAEIAEVLWTFEWTWPDPEVEGNQGEVTVYVEDGEARLELVVWTHDTEGRSPELGRLVTTSMVDPHDNARDQVRHIIHWHLCHEADETMLFDGEQTFWPH